jgi:hypothetical protein
MNFHVKRSELKSWLVDYITCGDIAYLEMDINKLIDKKLDLLLYLIQQKSEDIKNITETIPNAFIIKVKDLKQIRESFNEDQELIKGLIEEGDLKMCESCGIISPITEWTCLSAGFNGIEKGDKDDINKFECNHCNHIQE